MKRFNPRLCRRTKGDYINCFYQEDHAIKPGDFFLLNKKPHLHLIGMNFRITEGEKHVFKIRSIGF